MLTICVLGLNCDQPVQEEQYQNSPVEPAEEGDEKERESSSPAEDVAAEPDSPSEQGDLGTESSSASGESSESEASEDELEGDANATTEAEGAPSRMDPKELFIEAAPVPRPQLTPHLASALDHVRVAMRERDFLATREHLQEAASYRRTDEDKRSYERMLLVHTLWTQGWHHATAAARALEPGDHINTWGGPAVVKDKTDDQLMLQVGGTPQKFSIHLSEMPVKLAAALVEHRARRTGLALDAHVAALWIFDAKDSMEAAREACIEAAQRGFYVDHLIAELPHR